MRECLSPYQPGHGCLTRKCGSQIRTPGHRDPVIVEYGFSPDRENSVQPRATRISGALETHQIKQFLSIPIPSNLCSRGLIYLSLSDPMTAPNTGTITASLERSLQKISLNGPGGSGGGAARVGRSSSSEDISESQLNNSDATLELNSHVSLPYHWEQCLDLQTGEIYYINWRTGMRAKEDPRLTGDYTEDYYYSDEDEDDSSNCDSGESSSVSSPADFHSPAAAREPPPLAGGGGEKDSVLVVGGCKMCLMYFMVPKQVEDCPKCSGRLVLHFNGSP
ncbi:hypothetical protein SAY87_016137 [Trapa incisa]|uniref:WW domain-containing protein n=1 Tax=Trapa incisa TaxID=236973 RepID=A0AAN7QX82_9MYRT|nr:hypothetical protein SAY87_016137 [Trapa incisa]